MHHYPLLNAARLNQGAALVTSMILMLVVTLIAAMNMRGAVQQERVSASFRDASVALESATAGALEGVNLVKNVTNVYALKDSNNMIAGFYSTQLLSGSRRHIPSVDNIRAGTGALTSAALNMSVLYDGVVDIVPNATVTSNYAVEHSMSLDTDPDLEFERYLETFTIVSTSDGPSGDSNRAIELTHFHRFGIE